MKKTTDLVSNKAGKKGRRIGRKNQYSMYAIEGRRLKNKKRRLLRHIKRLPKDLQAQNILMKL